MAGKWTEFRKGWPALLATFMGMAFGITGLFTFNIGLFAGDLQNALNMSRADYGLGLLVLTLFLFISAPAAAWLIDRYGPKFPAIFGAILLAIGFAVLATSVRHVLAYFLVMAFFGVVGALSSPIGYTRTITGWFEKSRGLALGLAMSSIGISSIFVPVAVAHAIQEFGWRAGFLLLAIIAAASLPTTVLLLRLNPAETDAPTQYARENAQEKFSSFWRSKIFWLMLFSFSVMSFGFVGFTLHLIPLLRDSGLSTVQAANIAALMGISIIVSRVLIGGLADIIHAPHLAAGICILGGCAALLLLSHLPFRLPLAVLSLGIVLGAENDLMGYLTARYFGRGLYARAYGWQFACFTLSAGLGATVTGAIYDHSGSYNPALIMMAALAFIAFILFMALPRRSAFATAAS